MDGLSQGGSRRIAVAAGAIPDVAESAARPALPSRAALK